MYVLLFSLQNNSLFLQNFEKFEIQTLTQTF